MSFAGGILMIVSGLAIMGFGLFLFYAWLPLLYGLIGFDIGLLLGRWLSGGEVGTFAIILGIVGAIALGLASYTLEPYRRVLLGVSGGVLVGLALAAIFGLEGAAGGFFNIILAAIFGLIGAVLVPRYFDTFVVVASSLSGASLVVAGAQHILPNLGLLDAGGGFVGRLLTVVLAVVGIGWQYSNLNKWVQAQIGDLPPR